MYIKEWISGYHVEINDWYDGKHYHINVAYYAPGSSLARPPQRERSVLIPIDNWDRAKMLIGGLTETIARMPEHEPGDLPIIRVA